MGMFEDGLDECMAETNKLMREKGVTFEEARKMVGDANVSRSTLTTDPTYDKEQIRLNGTWGIAFIISEMVNDSAPIGWGKYIPLAKEVIDKAKKL